MSITKSIVASARPIALRGGRLRKRGGQVISFAPHFSDLLAGASRVALGGVLILSGVAALSPNSAMAEPLADKCLGTTTILCSGPADSDGYDNPIDITVTQPGTNIETEAGFGIDSTSRNSYDPAISLSATNDADIVFVDEHQSSIAGRDAAIFAENDGAGDTSISVNGALSGARGISVAGYEGSDSGDVIITTADTSTVTAAINGVQVYKRGDGNVEIKTAGTISATDGIAITAYSEGTGDITISNSANLTSGGNGIYAGKDGASSREGNISITNSGAIDSDFGIRAVHYGSGSISIVTEASSEIDSKYQGIQAWHDGEGDISITTAGSITGGHVGIDARSSTDGTVSIVNSGVVNSDERAIRGQHVGAGTLDISNSGTLNSAGGYAVSAFAEAGSDIVIANTGTVNAIHPSSASIDGSETSAPAPIGTVVATAVHAQNVGDGVIAISNSGRVNSIVQAASLVNPAQEGNVFLDVTPANSTAYGVNAIHNGDGAIIITNGAGDINLLAISEDGGGTEAAEIISESTSDITQNFTAGGSIEGLNIASDSISAAIRAEHNGDGAISITNDGALQSTATLIGDLLIDGDFVNENSVTMGAAAAGIVALQAGDAEILIANNGVIQSTASDNSNLTLTAGNNIDDNFIASDITAYGIVALHKGDESITITNDGDINAAASFNGDLLLQSENIDGINVDLTVSAVGINAVHSGLGDINISNSADINVSSTAGGTIIFDGSNLFNDDIRITSTAIGIRAVQDGDGNITITNDGSIVTNADITTNLVPPFNDYENYSSLETLDVGIQVNHIGNGTIEITNTGDITTSGESITVDVIDRSDDGTNIANVAVTNTGTITSENDDAIIVQHYGNGDVLLTNSGTLNSHFDALDVDRSGTGNIDIITLASSVITAGDHGIEAEHDGEGDITITNAGTIDADDNGIDAEHGGDGNIAITNAGTINTNFGGIYAYHGDFGDIAITNAGTINAGDDGIDVFHYGEGNITITNAGTINADDNGIDAYHDGNGNITIANAGALNTAYYGIIAQHDGTGDVTITTNASSVINGAVIAVLAEHDGTGSINVTTDAGSTITNTQFGIGAFHQQDGDITITSNGVLNVSRIAIGAMHSGAGTIDITNNSLINGVAEAGIMAVHSGDGDIVITNTANVSGTNGAITAVANNGNVTITNTANVSGANSAITAGAINGNVTITNSGTLANNSGNSADVAILAYGNTSASVTITNSGTITGTISIGLDDIEYDEVAEEYVDVFVSGNDNFVNNGTWNTAGGINNFGVGNDQITNSGTINAANASFIGLENFVNNGTLSLANDQAGDTLTTDGAMQLNAEGNVILDISGNDVDQIIAGGDVDIDGSTLTINAVGPRAVGERYTLVTADNVAGQFGDNNIVDTAFLDLELDYSDPTKVDLTIEQVLDFADVATTANQRSAATALDGLNSGNDLIDELLYLPDAAAANAAFDQLSGEAHATLRTALAEDSRLPRNAVLNRLQNRDGSAVWGEIFHGTGNLDQAKNRNTGGAQRDASGFILGVDASVTENVTVGFAASLIDHENDQKLRSSKADAETVHLLGYVGAELGKARFKLGAGYAWGDINTSRSVSFGRFNDRLNANYDASLLQAFAELGYRLPLGGGYVEPMANVIYLDTTTDGFTETGGLAALTVDKRSETTTLSTLGARFSTRQSGIFSVNGMVGWQHGFGKLSPISTMTLGDSDSFIIAGAPQSRDAAVAQVEAKFDVEESVSIGLGYDGVLGNVSHDHAAKVSIRLKF